MNLIPRLFIPTVFAEGVETRSNTIFSCANPIRDHGCFFHPLILLVSKTGSLTKQQQQQQQQNKTTNNIHDAS